MIHPATELRRVGARIGYGVFATAPIPSGTVTWVHDPFDQRFTVDAAEQLAPVLRVALDRYAYRDLDGAYLLCWDHARFNNHSCRPACRTIGDFDLAVRDIAAGDELTIEYATINVPEELACECGQPDCRRVIKRGDADQFGAAWDAEIRQAATQSASVAQPLTALFAESPTLSAMLTELRGGRAPSLPRSRDLVLRDGP